MVRCKFMCNCYDPPFREEVTVRAETFDEGWEKAKKKAAKKYNANRNDVAITSSYWEVIDNGGRLRGAMA